MLLILISICGYYFLRSADQIEKPHTPAKPASQSKIRLPAEPPPSGQAKLVELLEKGTSPLASENFASFIASHGERAAAWAAVYDLSGDPKLLKAALDKFPGDHRLLLRAILTLNPPDDRQAYIDEFLQRFPNESTADYASAFLKFKKGDSKAALEQMKIATGKKPPVVFDNEDALNRKAALESAGIPAKEAALYIFSAPVDLNPDNGIKGILPKLLTSGASNEMLSEVGLAYCVHQLQTKNKSAIGEHQAMVFEEAFLSKLPGDLEYGETGQTVTERLQAVRAENEKTTALLLQAKRFWQTASEEDVRSWSEAALAGGEIFAYKRWAELTNKPY